MESGPGTLVRDGLLGGAAVATIRLGQGRGVAATDMVTTLSWEGGLQAAEEDRALQRRFIRRQQEAARPGTYWIYADEMPGSWARRQNYPGCLGEWFRSPEDEFQKQSALGLELGLARAGQYHVWVHALIGGLAPDRALVTGLNQLTFPESHGEADPAAGKFVWHEVGEAEMPGGIASLTIRATGGGSAGLDAVVLTQDPAWQPPNSRSSRAPPRPNATGARLSSRSVQYTDRHAKPGPMDEAKAPACAKSPQAGATQHKNRDRHKPRKIALIRSTRPGSAVPRRSRLRPQAPW